MTPTTGPFDDGFDEEVNRGLEALNRYRDGFLPAAGPVAKVHDEAAMTAEPPVDTPAVEALRREVAEGVQLRELYARRYELNLDTERVIRRKLKGQEAAKLHVLAQDPATRALQAAKALRVLTATGLFALVLALGWSTVNVHTFAAAGAAAWTAGWVVGWFVEPFLSTALLTIVGAKAFFATRGHQIDSPTLDKIEWLFLALTLGMNVYPTLPTDVGGPAAVFHLPSLVLHSLGPIVAVAIVRGLPILWAEFGRLDHGVTAAVNGFTGSPTPPAYRENVSGQAQRLADLTVRARELVGKGALPSKPSASAIRQALGCGMDHARKVRDVLLGKAV